MLAGPQPATRTRKKPQGRTRAQTEFKPSQNNTRDRAQTDYKQNASNNTNNANTAQTDDFLDLFSFSNNNGINGNDVSNNTNTNAFDDFGFATFDETKNGNADSSGNDGKSATKKKKKKVKKEKKAPKQKTAAPPVLPRAQTVDVKPMSPPKSNSKVKKIDVLPLLHKGIRANKFKENGNKSKVRTFYLTDSNFYLCWEAPGGSVEKKGLFGKSKPVNRNKIDKDRSIPVRTIRDLRKNPAYMMNNYKFIPLQQKSLTLTIIYSTNGSDKKLNFMLYEPFHHQLFFDGMTQLISAARDPKRNLSEVFELYVDFPKEILPKHLRPQRFKWEPLGDNDFKEKKDDSNADDTTNSFQDIDVYDPTQAQLGRDRVKSF